jgi:hypothetical protein
MPTIATDTVRVAVEIRDDHGTWRRAVTVPHDLPAPAEPDALHAAARTVMDSCYVDWCPRAGEPVTRRHGRPIRALVLPVDPSDGDDIGTALWIWGGTCMVGP